MSLKASIFVIACALFALAQCTGSVYFYLEEGQKRCFLEEVPKDTLVVGRYRSELMDNINSGQVGAIRVQVTDPDGNPVLQRDMLPSGRFAYTSQSGGEHKLCFQMDSTRWFGTKHQVKFFLDLETGESATDYDEVAKAEQLSALEVKIRRLNDRIKDIRSEQNYQRNREKTFRNTSESTNSRVMWWSILQTLILVGTGMWQISHLRNFFKTKKLV